MTARGETTFVAPKEQAFIVNLSGKRTLVGRGSGECCFWQPPKGKATFWLNFQVQGQRILFIDKGVFCPFLHS